MERVPHGLRPILFFDGDCVLCNRAVRWVLAHEALPVIRFAPLNSATAKQHLSNTPWASHEASLLWSGPHGHILDASDAALAVCRQLKAPWRWLAVLKWVPKPIRDAAYASVAKRRFRWFGQTEHCALLRDVDPNRLLP